MPATAPGRDRLLSQLRTSFVSQPTTDLSQFQTQVTQPATPIEPVKPASVIPPTPTATQTFFSTNEQLDVLENAMNQVLAAKPVSPTPVTPAEPTAPVTPASPQPVAPQPVAPLVSVMPQALDQTAQAAQQQLQPTTAQRTKEVLPAQPVTETPAVEVPQVSETVTASAAENPAAANPAETATSAPYQEVGPVSPEISPEVESYLQEVISHHEQLPQEIVINNQDVQVQPPAQPLRPVIILPITQEVEVEGAKKSTSWSVRWLVEWSRRLMKMFAGKVVYQETET